MIKSLISKVESWGFLKNFLKIEQFQNIVILDNALQDVESITQNFFSIYWHYKWHYKFYMKSSDKCNFSANLNTKTIK